MFALCIIPKTTNMNLMEVLHKYQGTTDVCSELQEDPWLLVIDWEMLRHLVKDTNVNQMLENVNLND